MCGRFPRLYVSSLCAWQLLRVATTLIYDLPMSLLMALADMANETSSNLFELTRGRTSRNICHTLAGSMPSSKTHRTSTRPSRFNRTSQMVRNVLPTAAAATKWRGYHRLRSQTFQQAKEKYLGKATGLEWIDVGGPPPAGCRKLNNDKLAEALKHKTQFTPEEWESFNIHSLEKSCFIRVGWSYFVPYAQADMHEFKVCVIWKLRAGVVWGRVKLGREFVRVVWIAHTGEPAQAESPDSGETDSHARTHDGGGA
eukprot:6604199-Prymnesium_polylepis.1